MRIFCALCAVGLLLAAVAPAAAFDGNPVGARPLGMGEAFSAIAGDANCLEWNPAGLAFLTHKEFNSMYGNLYGIDLKNSYLTYASPWGENAGLGIDWSRVAFDDSELNYTDDRMTMGAGYRFMRDASAGVAARYYGQDIKLDNSSVGAGSGWGFDFGVLYAFSDRESGDDAYSYGFLRDTYRAGWYRWLGKYKVRTALTVHDVNTPNITYDAGGRGTVANAQWTWGMAAEPYKGLTVAFDLNDRYNLGCEYWWKGMVAARAGVQRDFKGDNGMVWSAGMGAAYRNLQCDYAYTDYPTLPATHRFSVAWMFDFYDAQVMIERATVNDLYASNYKSYVGAPAGEVLLRNNADEAFTVKVGAYIDGYMDAFTEQEVTLAPRSTRTVPLNLVFNDKVRHVTKDAAVQARVRIRYDSDRRTNTREVAQKLTIYGINSLTWSEPMRYGAFISAKDEVVQDFVRGLVSRSDKVPTYLTPNIYRAMQIYDALGAAGIRYVRDPNISLAAALGGEIAVDYVQHPRELLLRRTGDCDDMVALFASCLENIQIATMLILTPDHIFLMFDSGLPKGVVSEADIARGLYIVREDRVWMPVEATLMGASFSAAWREGAVQYTKLFDRQNVTLINTAQAWNTYPPPTLDPTTERATYADSAYVALLAEDDAKYREYKEEEIKKLILAWGSKLPDDNARKFYAGLLYAQAAFYDEGLRYFSEVARAAPAYPGVHVNLGNLYLIREDFARAKTEYTQALEQDPYIASAHLNLALLLFREGKVDDAKRHYLEAQDLDPKYRGYFPELE